MCILCILFIVVSLYIFFTGLKYSDQVSFAFTMYRFFSVLWALKMSRFIFSFALAFLVLYVFLCLAGVFAIFVHAFHVCPFSFFPLGLRDVFQDVLLACFCIFRGFSQVKQNNDDDDYNNSSSLSTHKELTRECKCYQLIRSHNRSAVVNECRKCSRETQHYKTPRIEE